MATDLKAKPEVRSIVTDDEFGGFRITIPPSSKAWMGTGIVVAIWALVVLLFILGLARRPLSGNWEGIKFFCIWLAMGLGFVLIAAASWLRRDTVIIEGKTLLLRKQFASIRMERLYELNEVRNLRPAPPDDANRASADQAGRMSAVAFDYKNKTIQFGFGLSEIEVMRLIRTIRERFPIRDDWKEVEPLPVSR